MMNNKRLDELREKLFVYDTKNPLESQKSKEQSDDMKEFIELSKQLSTKEINELHHNMNFALVAFAHWGMASDLLCIVNSMQAKIDELKEENRKLDSKRHIASNCAEGMHQQLQSGRDYLMSVEWENLNVSDALEAFGFGKNGLG